MRKSISFLLLLTVWSVASAQSPDPQPAPSTSLLFYCHLGGNAALSRMSASNPYISSAPRYTVGGTTVLGIQSASKRLGSGLGLLVDYLDGFWAIEPFAEARWAFSRRPNSVFGGLQVGFFLGHFSAMLGYRVPLGPKLRLNLALEARRRAYVESDGIYSSVVSGPTFGLNVGVGL